MPSIDISVSFLNIIHCQCFRDQEPRSSGITGLSKVLNNYENEEDLRLLIHNDVIPVTAVTVGTAVGSWVVYFARH